MLDTQTYQRDCLRMFGHYLHHAPSFGNDTDEKAEMVQQQQDMLQLYSNEFGESAGRDMWPMTPSDPSSDEKMPDCCSVRQPTFFLLFFGSVLLPFPAFLLHIYVPQLWKITAAHPHRVNAL